ncbi:hypothetical protein AMJ80_03455 [bacterium SM23_31]|nr:MAG: hypothetical protein AMJ80_03455 [bacterium SM23_31]
MNEFGLQEKLYHHLDEETLDYLYSVGAVWQYDRDDVIFLEADPARHFYLILSGSVKISRLNREGDEVVIAILTPGNFFGDMAILDGFPRSADAVAEEKTKILAIRDDDFYNLLENSPRIAIELLKELAHRIRSSGSQIKGLSLLNARGKVASALLRWAQDQGVRKGSGMEIRSAQNQEEMASYVGLSRETYNRILRKLEDEGFIAKHNANTIIINNFTEFRKVFGPFC